MRRRSGSRARTQRLDQEKLGTAFGVSSDHHAGQAGETATLYATGQDTVSAWVNGAKVLKAAPLPPYKQMPWKKFVRAEVTSKLAQGANTIAIEAMHYIVNPNGEAKRRDAADDRHAGCGVRGWEEGRYFGSDTKWKTAIHASGMAAEGLRRSGWKRRCWPRHREPESSSALGHPWIPDSVKSLRHEFDVTERR